MKRAHPVHIALFSAVVCLAQYPGNVLANEPGGITLAKSIAVTKPVTELVITDTKIGDGAKATAGQHVSVHYTGWLYDPKASDFHGKKFDSSLDRSEPFKFPLGARRVISGWDQGVVGMKVGGKRTLIIPGKLAYGKRGAGGGIPPDATLIFDVELVKIE